MQTLQYKAFQYFNIEVTAFCFHKNPYYHFNKSALLYLLKDANFTGIINLKSCVAELKGSEAKGPFVFRPLSQDEKGLLDTNKFLTPLTCEILFKQF